MSHQRSKSTSSLSFDNPTNTAKSGGADTTAPLSITIPRQRSMSTSLGMTSPIAFAGSSIISNPNASNPFFNPIISPTSSASSSSMSAAGFGTTPPTNLSGLSSSIPSSSINRRFSASFSNPLNNHPLAGGGSATNGAQTEERGRRPSLFGSSPPVSRQIGNNDTHTNNHPSSVEPAGVGGGGAGAGAGGGIGGLFRKFSVSGRSGATASQHHPFDTNEAGPPPSMGPLSNSTEANSGPAHTHLNVVDALKPSNQPRQDKNSRSSSPMRNMILNGQMLD